MQDLAQEQVQAEQRLKELDEVSREMERKWGINRLPRCVSPELAAKFQRQWDKLSHAIMTRNHADTITLAAGALRGWQAMEAEAIAHGYTPDVGRVLECRIQGSNGLLRVCEASVDVQKPVPKGYHVYSMEQIARIVSSKQLVILLNATPDKPLSVNEAWKSEEAEIV